MPSWVVGVAGTIALSMVSAYGFLLLRCRGTGHPFGPRSKSWAITVVVITATISTALGVAAVAAGHHVRAAYVGVIVPSGLWLGKASAQRRSRRGSLLPKPLVGYLALPLHCLDDRMGDDLQDWCDTRSRAVSGKPQRVAGAAQYYYNQVAGRLKDDRAREELSSWRDSIRHKIEIVQMIGRYEPLERVENALQSHASTSNTHKYDADDLPRLARRLESEAENELHLFLAFVYRRGYRKLLIYPFRPTPAPRRKPPGRDLPRASGLADT
jgi:hypothetical protein